MWEPAALILFPGALVVLRVKHLAVVQLLSLDLGEVLVDLQVPIFEDFGLRENCRSQVTDAVISNRWIRDHVVSYIPHFVGILSEIFGETTLVAS